VSRAIAVLRPEPGNSATAAHLAERGFAVICLPLFNIVPLAWEVPDPADFDALILTSANTLRHGGAELGWLKELPVHAVGAATADVARAHGFNVASTGSGNADALLADLSCHGVSRALHLGGREAMVAAGGRVRQSIAVYASDAVDLPDDAIAAIANTVAMLHSARAAARLAALVDRSGLQRASLRLAAISAAVGDAAGPGWADIAIAPAPTDAALIDVTTRLAD